MKLRPQVLPLNSLRLVTRCILGLVLIVLLQAGNDATPPATAAPDPTNDEGRATNAGIAEALTNTEPAESTHPQPDNPPSQRPPSRRPQSVDSPSAQNVELIGQVGGTAHVVVAQGNYAYVTDGTGLRVIDVSDPTAPVEVGSHRRQGLLSTPMFLTVMLILPMAPSE